MRACGRRELLYIFISSLLLVLPLFRFGSHFSTALRVLSAPRRIRGHKNIDRSEGSFDGGFHRTFQLSFIYFCTCIAFLGTYLPLVTTRFNSPCPYLPEMQRKKLLSAGSSLVSTSLFSLHNFEILAPVPLPHFNSSPSVSSFLRRRISPP